jgi:hypothetical protein
LKALFNCAIGILGFHLKFLVRDQQYAITWHWSKEGVRKHRKQCTVDDIHLVAGRPLAFQETVGLDA